MKFIGQYIQSFIARFRSDVYLEDIDAGTIASGGNLGLDSNNKIVKAAETTGDITSVSLISDSGTINGLTGAVNFTVAGGTGISTSATGSTLTVTETTEKKTKSDIDALTGVTENNLGTFTGSTIPDSKNIKEVLQALETKAEVDAAAGTKGIVELATTAESNTGTDTSKAVTPDALNDWTGGSASVTKLGTIGTGVWQGTAIATAYIADDAVTEGKLANTLLAEIDANTAKATNVSTNLSQTTASTSLRIESSDGNNVVIAEASGSIAGVMTVAHHDKLDGIETSATADQTKSDIDGLAITTVGTIDTGVWNGTAIATAYQKHLAYFEFEGFSVGDGTNYMIAELNSDTKAPFEHQTSTGSDGLTATGPVRLLKTAGHVMPYAGTLKLWKGWATSSGGASQTVDVGLYKATLVNNNSVSVSPVALKNTSFTSVGNSKPLSFSEDSFDGSGESDSFAAGDILISAIRNGTNGKRCDFSSTLVVEWN